MDVRCDKCGTEYEFEADRVTEQGVTVRCTECGHVFKVRRRTVAVTEPIAPAPATPGAGAGGEKAWMVRRENGDVYSFRELTTLQKWIVERKVTRADEISRSGETWKRLGNIAELATFFQVVEQAERAAQVAVNAPATSGEAATAIPLTTTSPAQPAAPAPQAPPTTPVPPAAAAPQAPSPQPPAPPVAPPPQAPPAAYVPPPPAAYVPPPPAHGSAPGPDLGALSPASERTWNPPADDFVGDLDDDDFAEFKKGGKGKWVFLLILLLAGGAGGFYYLRPAQFKALVGLTPKIPVAAQAKVAAGRRALAPDTLDAYQSAEGDFQAAVGLAGKSPYPAAEAGLAETDVRWALALREQADAAATEAKAQGKALDVAPEADGGVRSQAGTHDAVAALANKANDLNQKAAAKLDAAFAAARKAMEAAPDALPSVRAMIGYYVAEASQAQLDTLLDKADRLQGSDKDADLAYLRGLALGVEGAAPAKVEGALMTALALDGHLVAARYALARTYADAKDAASARVQLTKLLANSPDHARAKALLAHLGAAPSAKVDAAKAHVAKAAAKDAGAAPTKTPETATAAAAPAAGAANKTPKAPAKHEKAAVHAPAHRALGYDGLLSAAYRLRNAGKIQKALDLYGRARDLKPDRAEPYAGQGWCYMEMHAPAPAIASFHKALKRNPEYGEAVMGMAEAHRAQGDTKAARKYYKRYLELLPDGPDAAVAKTNLKGL